MALKTPAGRVDVEHERNGPCVESVRLFNVTSDLDRAEMRVEVPGLGAMTVDIAGLVSASRALAAAADPCHPEDDLIGGLHHVVWCDEALRTSRVQGRSAVLCGGKTIDRSPGGISACMAHSFTARRGWGLGRPT